MRHIFKASFEQEDDARHLLEQLIAAGYTQASLALSGATHAGPYTRQRHAVTLTVDSDQEARQALALMERSHPARLQDNLQDQEMLLPDAAAPDVRPAPEPPRRAGVEPGALQFHHLEDSPLFGTQDATAPPAGTTFQERMGRTALWDEAEPGPMPEWTSAAAPAGDPAAPAPGDDGAVHDAAKHTLWERFEDAFHHGSPVTWYKVKEAVRHGWGRGRH